MLALISVEGLSRLEGKEVRARLRPARLLRDGPSM